MKRPAPSSALPMLLAAAVWLVWTLFQNSEAVLEAIGKARGGKTKSPPV